MIIPANVHEKWRSWFPALPLGSDPRWVFAGLLSLYCILGVTLFGFNRTPWQALFIVASGALLDFIVTLWSTGKKIFPLSMWISCCSLAILLNYSHGSILLFLPVLLTLTSKHILTVDGRHTFNPSMFGVSTSLLIGNDMITAAPAYQWAGSSLTITFFLIAAACALFVLKIGKTWLIVSFLFFYALQTGVRAYVMKHHIPPEMLFIGTMTTPSFFLFTMYMLTDPATSPKTPRGQIMLAFVISLIDLVLHFKASVFTFLYAALSVATIRFIWTHGGILFKQGFTTWIKNQWLSPIKIKSVMILSVLWGLYALIGWTRYDGQESKTPVNFTLEKISPEHTGLHASMSDVLTQVDPRVAHVAKWILSVGDASAAADVDNDGDIDLFLTQPLKDAPHRSQLYLNQGDMRFSPKDIQALQPLRDAFKQHGLAGGASFFDMDNDGDQDLFINVAYGKSRMLRNELHETGVLNFVDVSEQSGFDEHTVSLGSIVLDVENDGDLDMIVLNALTPYLFEYDKPTPLNIFALPAPAYDGDRRMFQFMHNGWHDADNAGKNLLYLNSGNGTFIKQNSDTWGLSATHWSLVGVSADFNHDGYGDIYIANDFGPDELYYNEQGKRFIKIQGTSFSDVGKDTYKGMNASAADVDRNGYLDVYVSNVHHRLQAEGSLLWMFYSSENALQPKIQDEATKRNALNEHRFAWGAAMGDMNRDGWVDMMQANGMVDDRLDRLYGDNVKKDYWYVNHKLMQSGPEMHTYADMWADLRGRTIYPNEARRVYINQGKLLPGHFVDVVEQTGGADPDNSRGVLLADLDNDGDLDSIVTNQHGETSVYRMNSRNDFGWLCIDLIGDGQNVPRQPVGTIVEVYDDLSDEPQRQELQTTQGFASQFSGPLFFGLGENTDKKMNVKITWRDGKKWEGELSAKQCHSIKYHQ
jgi:hypothetical protein